MRIGELSARTGVPAATIKYYVREGLLSSGERRSHNQVEYGEAHVRRLRLVRALVETGSLPIATVREVLAKIADREGNLDSTLGVVAPVLTPAPATEPGERYLELALAAMERQGWHRVNPGIPQVRALAEVLERLELLGLGDMVDRIDEYAAAAESAAASDLRLLGTRVERDEILETMILGTVLGDALFSALRRIAQVEMSGRTFKARERQRPEPEDC